MRVERTAQLTPSLKSSQGLVFIDSHLKTSYPGSPGGGLFVQINKQNHFESKELSKFHPIILNPLTIRSPQADTIPHLHYSIWG